MLHRSENHPSMDKQKQPPSSAPLRHPPTTEIRNTPSLPSSKWLGGWEGEKEKYSCPLSTWLRQGKTRASGADATRAWVPCHPLLLGGRELVSSSIPQHPSAPLSIQELLPAHPSMVPVSLLVDTRLRLISTGPVRQGKVLMGTKGAESVEKREVRVLCTWIRSSKCRDWTRASRIRCIYTRSIGQTLFLVRQVICLSALKPYHRLLLHRYATIFLDPHQRVSRPKAKPSMTAKEEVAASLPQQTTTTHPFPHLLHPPLPGDLLIWHALVDPSLRAYKNTCSQLSLRLCLIDLQSCKPENSSASSIHSFGGPPTANTDTAPPRSRREWTAGSLTRRTSVPAPSTAAVDVTSNPVPSLLTAASPFFPLSVTASSFSSVDTWRCCRCHYGQIQRGLARLTPCLLASFIVALLSRVDYDKNPLP
ncbi:hypothetical protein IF2G_05023 [Cordyceps javanica]|nr:hypothetical protein IF2G_05023 [Cordyceps javanica]